MENLTPGEIVALIVGLALALAGAVNTVGSAVEKIAKVVRAAKAPNAAQDERLDALEARMDKYDQFFEMDKKRMDGLDSTTRLTQRALLALLEHGIDGNNVERMKSSRDELQNYLINR